MNKDFRKTLDARLSGMRWGEREQDGVLQRIRQEEASRQEPAQRKTAPLIAALAALIIIAGSALTLRILPAPVPEASPEAPEQSFESVLQASAPQETTAAMPGTMHSLGPTFDTERLTISILDASCTSDGAWAQLCILPREGSTARLIVATDEARAASNTPQDLHVTLRMETAGQGREQLAWQGTQTLAFSGYAEVRFVTEAAPNQEGLPVLLTVEVQDGNGAVLEITEHRFTLARDGAEVVMQP